MNSSDIRYRARQDLAGKWGVAILAGFLAALLGGLVSSSGGGNFDLDQQEIARLPDILKTYLLIAASIGAVMGTITLIVGGTVELGYSKFLLKMHDGEDAKVEDLFSQFHRFGDGFCQRLLRALFVALWSVLFVIPGIVASLKYAMTPFILAEKSRHDCQRSHHRFQGTDGWSQGRPVLSAAEFHRLGDSECIYAGYRQFVAGSLYQRFLRGILPQHLQPA